MEGKKREIFVVVGIVPASCLTVLFTKDLCAFKDTYLHKALSHQPFWFQRASFASLSSVQWNTTFNTKDHCAFKDTYLHKALSHQPFWFQRASFASLSSVQWNTTFNTKDHCAFKDTYLHKALSHQPFWFQRASFASLSSVQWNTTFNTKDHCAFKDTYLHKALSHQPFWFQRASFASLSSVQQWNTTFKTTTITKSKSSQCGLKKRGGAWWKVPLAREHTLETSAVSTFFSWMTWQRAKSAFFSHTGLVMAAVDRASSKLAMRFQCSSCCLSTDRRP